MAINGALALLPAEPAAAQVVLPGAVAPTPQGSTQAPRRASAKPARSAGERVIKGVAVAVPGLALIAGRTLSHNGQGSQVTFAPGKTLEVTKLALAGDRISKSSELCQLDVSGMPMAVTALGRPNGLERYRIEFPACPIAFDVLAGAIVVDPAQTACDFAEADCRISPAGLWGPGPADLGPDRVKGLERERAAAEGAVRGNYKALTASTKDRHLVMGIAHDQAQFSSSREEVCRDYAEEGRHGFCSTKLTEARAALLRDQVDAALAAKAAKKAAKEAARQAVRHRPGK